MNPLVQIRPGSRSDVAAAARANVEGWRAAFRDLLPADFLGAMSIEGRAKALAARFEEPDYAMAVAETQDGDVVGFADWGINRHAQWPHDRELYAIYLLPSYQGRGLGRRLFQAAAEGILEGGLHSMLLCVLGINPHLGFYRRLGGQEVGSGHLEVAGEDRPLVYYGWSPSALRLHSAS